MLYHGLCKWLVGYGRLTSALSFDEAEDLRAEQIGHIEKMLHAPSDEAVVILQRVSRWNSACNLLCVSSFPCWLALY